MSRQRRRPSWPAQKHYPRMARVNQLLREVLAEEGIVHCFAAS